MEKLEHTVFQISELIGKERFGTLSEDYYEAVWLVRAFDIVVLRVC